MDVVQNHQHEHIHAHTHTHAHLRDAGVADEVAGDGCRGVDEGVEVEDGEHGGRAQAQRPHVEVEHADQEQPVARCRGRHGCG
jgi:hypothetical protein